MAGIKDAPGGPNNGSEPREDGSSDTPYSRDRPNSLSVILLAIVLIAGLGAYLMLRPGGGPTPLPPEVSTAPGR